jgi:hypothetical protein
VTIVATFKDGKIGRAVNVAPLHVTVTDGDWDTLATKIVRLAKRHLASKGVDCIVYENNWGIVTAGDRVVAEFEWKKD